jgi:hypothetical protein
LVVLASLALTAALTVPCGGQPPAPLSPFDGVPRLGDCGGRVVWQPGGATDALKAQMDNLSRQHLENIRRWRKRTEENLALYESVFPEESLYTSSGKRTSTGQKIDRVRAHLEWLKAQEREVAAELGISLLPAAPAPRAIPRPLAPMPRERRID